MHRRRAAKNSVPVIYGICCEGIAEASEHAKMAAMQGQAHGC